METGHVCTNQWNHEPCHVRPSKMDRSWWRVLTKHGPLEKGMVNHFSILALRISWTVWKGKKIRHWKKLPSLVDAQCATGKEWRNTSRKNEEDKPKWKQHPGKDMTGDGSKVWCCKEQYCIGTWNVRSMNQGKQEIIKQGMARVNISILGISKLKWTGIGEFNSDDPYISTTAGMNLLEEME